MSLTPTEVSQLEGLLAKARAAGIEVKPRPKGMTEEEHEAHVAASEAEHARNAAYNADPRAAHFALEARIAALEGGADDQVEDEADEVAPPTPPSAPAEKKKRRN